MPDVFICAKKDVNRDSFSRFISASVTVILTVLIFFACVAYCTGESSFEVKIEADSNDIAEHPYDDKPRPYLCPVCDKRFTTKQNLNYHKEVHAGALLYSCAQCEKRFATRHYLRIHMNVHSGKYKCTECGKCFSNGHALTVHGRSHSGEKPFECTVCSKRFAQSHSLAQHSRIQHSRVDSLKKLHKCLACGMEFILSASCWIA